MKEKVLDHKAKLKGGSKTGLNFGVVKKWEDRWDILPEVE